MFGQNWAGFVAGGVMALGLGGSAAAATATIEKPMFNGHRLDWCLNWKANCGKPVADAFCQARGFGRAISYAKAPDIGNQAPTRVLSTGAICDLAGCDGFRQITCLKQPALGASKQPAKQPAAAASPAPTAGAPESMTRTEKLAAFARTAVYGPVEAPHAAGAPKPVPEPKMPPAAAGAKPEVTGSVAAADVRPEAASKALAHVVALPEPRPAPIASTIPPPKPSADPPTPKPAPTVAVAEPKPAPAPAGPAKPVTKVAAPAPKPAPTVAVAEPKPAPTSAPKPAAKVATSAPKPAPTVAEAKPAPAPAGAAKPVTKVATPAPTPAAAPSSAKAPLTLAATEPKPAAAALKPAPVASEPKPAAKLAAPTAKPEPAPASASSGGGPVPGPALVPLPKPVAVGSTSDAKPPSAAGASAASGEVKVASTAPVPLPAARPAPARSQVFAEPLFNGKRLDWCRGVKDGCGKVVADDWCKAQGFLEAAAFTPDPHIGASKETRQLASGLICDEARCDGFKAITCSD